ncbi:sigma 54-interacting transcriptional regulator [uncultured Lacinutrix sp.]|uniref:sigma 54-interacting transcriptional regulator n=1 Tax=uncultured Lacinutrix sp. TaxID=574032 RepID=UPI00260AB9FB|nr:sigma 54-interacting transcriptional regulator [uncultured Lacinutrix sp.]
MEYRNDQVDIFISSGTAAMQTAWYLLAMQFKNVQLFQIRPPKFRKSNAPIKIPVSVEVSGITSGLEVIEHNEVKTKSNTNTIITASMTKLYQQADKIALTNNVTTVILGQTGTGKELIAKYIHKKSKRSSHRFIAINCAALGDNLLEGRLFGHQKGAFTGALTSSIGAFREADGGTIFLDEIGDISSKMQLTLLRVLQERMVAPLGTFKTVKIDVRVIVATHKNLWEMVNNGSFRADLFYRLMVANINTIPFCALKEEERIAVFDFFLNKKQLLFEREKPLILSKAAKASLLAYPFSGNFREVEYLITRCYIYCHKSIELEDIPYRIRHPKGTIASLRLDDLEKHHIRKVLDMFSGNQEKTRKALGISAGTMSNRMKSFGWNSS